MITAYYNYNITTFIPTCSTIINLHLYSRICQGIFVKKLKFLEFSLPIAYKRPFQYEKRL